MRVVVMAAVVLLVAGCTATNVADHATPSSPSPTSHSPPATQMDRIDDAVATLLAEEGHPIGQPT